MNRHRAIKLSEPQRTQVIDIAIKGIVSACNHICILKSLPSDFRLYYHGMWISLKQAKRRHKRCANLYNLALKGIMY